MSLSAPWHLCVLSVPGTGEFQERARIFLKKRGGREQQRYLEATRVMWDRLARARRAHMQTLRRTFVYRACALICRADGGFLTGIAFALHDKIVNTLLLVRIAIDYPV